MNTQGRHLTTPHGTIQFPAYIPVTTFGNKYPLDALIQPYLPRLCQAVMVSHHYAKQMKQRPRLPLLVDSGGFAALFQGSRIVEENGLGVLKIPNDDQMERLSPLDVLEFQEEKADVAFTLDFPIPPATDPAEAKRRQRLSIANAIWALRNRRRKEMRLYACIQAWDPTSAMECARVLAEHPFDGFAVGGLVPRARDSELIDAMTEAVLEQVGGRPVHAFGLGKPETTQRLFSLGVDSVDSSSYVKLAADGRKWSDPKFRLADPSTPDLLRLAIQNLATASSTYLPLATPRKMRQEEMPF